MGDKVEVARQMELRPVAELAPYAGNARTHDQDQLEALADSIRCYGFTAPVLVDAAGNILAGHARVAAAQLVGLDQVPVVVLDHLDDGRARAYVIADNALAERARWDDGLLAQELRDLAALDLDLAITGLPAEEIAAALDEAAGLQKEFQPLTPEDLAEAEAATERPGKRETEKAFRREMEDTTTQGAAPIVPMYAEHQQAFVIICDNTIDEAWLRNRLGLEEPLQSYKDSKVRQANVATVADLRKAFT